MRGHRTSIQRRIFFPSLLLACFFIVLSATPLTAADRTVRVGVYQNPPKVFSDDTGQPAGVFIDVIEHIATLEGWDLHYVYGTWGEGLDRLQRGEIDLMPDVAHTTERETIFDFHAVPVLSSWFQVYARKGSGIQSILDLAEKRIVVLERSVQQAAFTRLAEGFELNAKIIALPDYQTSFEKVARGEADAAITNRFYGAMQAKQFGLEDTAVIFNPSNLFFAALRERHPQLLNTIDKHLIRLRQNPQSVYYESLERWTSEKVEFALPDWVWMAGLVAGLALLMSLAGSIVLKRQVNVRTRQLRQINLEMEQRIQQRTAELAAAMEKAKAADRLKSAFLATMSHELRTPLNSIIGFTGILLQGLAGPLNDEQDKQMRMVQNSSRHLLALINDVLDISKIEAGQLSLSPAPFALRGAVEKTATLVTPMAEKKGIDLKVEIADDVAEITTDQRRLEQILINLLNNAVKFTEQGKVEISCRSDGDFYRIAVSDTGIGIRPEEIDRLFQPFHQIDTGLSRKHEGTGLGLSICKKLVDMMGGRIEVQSEWGRGSTFTVRIPKDEAFAFKIGADRFIQKPCEPDVLMAAVDVMAAAKTRSAAAQGAPAIQEEEVLQLYNERLVRKLEQKMAEAEREKLQARLVQAQKMEAVGRLAGGVAHDFNNMLGVILGYSEMALDKLSPDAPLHDDLTEIITAARRSAEITRQLLAFARQQTMAPKVVDLNETVEGMLRMLRRLIGEGIDLQWLPGGKLWRVKIDPSQMDQILANLCVNARDAIAGVGKITIETDNIRFDRESCAGRPDCVPGEYVTLAVSDDGCGMDEEVRHHLFEPFFTTKAVGQGTGLGLATIYGIVRQNDGFIDVDSKAGQGTTFKIYFPRHTGPPEAEDAAAAADIPSGNGETVLMVEDEASILKLGQTMLESLGYRVLAAAGTTEAIALAQTHAGKIHLLITDVVMPERNGRDLALQLQKRFPGLRVLFMSGYTANVIAHHGVLDEGMQFIQKPFSREELAVKVAEGLR